MNPKKELLWSLWVTRLSVGVGFRMYLNPESSTFLGRLIMISFYKSIKR